MEIRSFMIALVMLGVAAIITGIVVLPLVQTGYNSSLATCGFYGNTSCYNSSTTTIWNNIPIFFIISLLLAIVGLFAVVM